MVRILRLRPDSKRADVVKVHNDAAMKLEAYSIALEKKIKSLEDEIAELRAAVSSGTDE